MGVLVQFKCVNDVSFFRNYVTISLLTKRPLHSENSSFI